MASSKTGKPSKKRKSSSTRRKSSTAHKKTSAVTKKTAASTNFPWKREVFLFVLLVLAVLVFISVIGFGGRLGEIFRVFFFGMFGLLAYVFPFWLFIFGAFLAANTYNPRASRGRTIMKLISAILLLVAVCVFFHLIVYLNEPVTLQSVFWDGSRHTNGGGALGALFGIGMARGIGLVGAFLVTILLIVMAVVLLTERSIFSAFSKRGRAAMARSRARAAKRRELHPEKAEARAQAQKRKREAKQHRRENKASDRKTRGNRKHAERGWAEEDSRVAAAAVQKPLDSDYSLHKMRGVTTDTLVGDGDSKRISIDNLSELKELIRAEMNNNANKSGRNDAMQARDTEKTMEDAAASSENAVNQTSGAIDLPWDEDEGPVIHLSREENGTQEDKIEPAASTNHAGAEMSGEEVIDENVYEQMPEEIPAQNGEMQSNEVPDEGTLDGVQNGSRMNQDFSEDAKATEAAGEGMLAAVAAAEQEKSRSSRKKTVSDPQENAKVSEQIQSAAQQKPKRKYRLPSVSLLNPADPNATGDSREHLQKMSARLQMTLTNFGVDAKVTDVNCGPSVTRYEIQPAMGVKVSKIVNLADDIKLNLAVSDIRIEAPVPGKSVIGIEVPNKTNVPVSFRSLVESREFRKEESKIAFCAGKDISGANIIANIEKMPHLLIAGATGSGKSVCINTIIMSILFKAKPEEVRMIMIDPKIVELSVYNGIPHLLLPVVTDPKKAAGALNWAVTEMTDRYKKFAEYHVRDISSYNKKVQRVAASMNDGDGEKPEMMPQIVIIVDELADLMMVAPGDVEGAICRLAQLARAAGLHLVIATQRPSVNVITGLIKANMPSRIAFAVTSGVDSRTILDMNGAEKLLGKGDMLFYPQNYQKPLRVQGAFVSDEEVARVVEDIIAKNGDTTYDQSIEENIEKKAGETGDGGGKSSGDDRDVHFEEAGYFVIEKQKGSIGMLQRMFKVGFNRAARIMDQLEEAGVVGPEEGTKPRHVLMNAEEFRAWLNSQKEGNQDTDAL